jgi:putative N6-adenine-specific DNA methylase
LEKSERVFKLVAKTFQGLEGVLAKELKSIGAKNVEIQNRAVVFDGDKAMMYRANYHVRTAIAILKPLLEFTAENEDQLYKNVGRINWNKYMSVDDTLSVSAVTFGKTFTHSKYVSLKVKDAIVDQFRRRQGKRPNVNTISPDLKIHIHISEKNCTILLDSSGDPLFKRGYRIKTVKAPINEVLAAGMIKLSDWNASSNFIDPMCGSGTILIEAAMIAYNIAPGTYRKRFGFEDWNDFDADLFEEIAEESFNEVDFKYTISGSDVSPAAVAIAKENIKNAFLSKKISVNQQNFFDIKPDADKTVIITNPPYGERLQPSDLKIFYQKIGDKLKLDFAGYICWLIGSNTDVLKFVGLRPDEKIALYNGPLECSYRKYSLYQGSKKKLNKKIYKK